MFLEISQKSPENTCARVSFLIKLNADITHGKKTNAFKMLIKLFNILAAKIIYQSILRTYREDDFQLILRSSDSKDQILNYNKTTSKLFQRLCDKAFFPSK